MRYPLDKSLSTGKSNWFSQEPLLSFVMHVRWMAIYPVDIALSNFQTETCFLVEFEVANGHRKCTTTEGYLALVRVVIYWPRKTGSVFCRGTELSTVLVKKIVTK